MEEQTVSLQNRIAGIDFETGGHDPKINGATEVGIVIVDPLDFSETGFYNSYIKPYSKPTAAGEAKKKLRKAKDLDKDDDGEMIYTQDALDYTALTLDKLEREGKEMKFVVEEMKEAFSANFVGKKKPILLGHNVLYDIGYLQQLFAFTKNDLSKFVDCKLDYYGNPQPVYIDTLALTKHIFPNGETANHKLETICEAFDIELVAAHRAADDVYATIEVYKRIVLGSRAGWGSGTEKVKLEKSRVHFRF